MVEQELVHAIEAVLNSKKKLSKAESKVTSCSWNVPPTQPKTHPIQKPQLTFYHLRDDLCFYWVKITFWFWNFLFSQARSLEQFIF